MNANHFLFSSLFTSVALLGAVACDSSSDEGPQQSGTGGTAGEGGASSGGATSSGGGAPSGGAAGMGGGSGGASGSPLRGRVVDGAGVGVESARVLLEGRLYETAVDGSFDAEDVPDTYDLIVLPAGSREVSIWQNATRRQPIVIVPEDYAVHTVRVSGRITRDPELPSTAGMVTQVGFDCADGRRVPALEITSDDFELDVSWIGGELVTCRLLALEGNHLGGELAQFTAFASREITLESGNGPLRGRDLELQAVTTTEVAVRHDYVSDLASYAMSIHWGPFVAKFDYSHTNSTVIMWKAHVPDVAIPIWAEVESDGYRAKKRSTGGGLVLVDMSKEIRRMSPRDAESLAPDGEFSILVSPLLPEGLYRFDYELTSGVRLILHTTEETFRLPDLSPLGVELSGSATWSGTYSTNATSVDALLESEVTLLPDFSNTTPLQTFTFESSGAP